MNKNSRNEYEIKIKDEVTIDGHMQYFIDYAEKLFYPSRVVVSGLIGKYISVKSDRFLNDDEYSYFVEFDHEGKFQNGYSAFGFVQISNSSDQNEFKQLIKKQINKVNQLHSISRKLLNQ